MKSSETYSSGGYWMFAVLVMLIGLPPVIGHFFIEKDAPPSVHADASLK